MKRWRRRRAQPRNPNLPPRCGAGAQPRRSARSQLSTGTSTGSAPSRLSTGTITKPPPHVPRSGTPQPSEPGRGRRGSGAVQPAVGSCQGLPWNQGRDAGWPWGMGCGVAVGDGMRGGRGGRVPWAHASPEPSPCTLTSAARMQASKLKPRLSVPPAEAHTDLLGGGRVLALPGGPSPSPPTPTPTGRSRGRRSSRALLSGGVRACSPRSPTPAARRGVRFARLHCCL